MLLIKVFLFVCYCVSGQSVLLSLAPHSLGEYIKTDPIKKNKRRRGSDFEKKGTKLGAEHPSKRRKKTTDNGEKPYKCDECGKRYVRKGDYTNHKRMCDGENPYKCNECGKEFFHKSNYDKHERTHTKEKPFPCHVCWKRFSQKGDLKRHERIHTKEKPFLCGICDKKFSRSEDLRDHKRRHTGEKPFKCNECGKEFINNKDFRQHEKRKHLFAKDKDLTTHKKKHNECTKCDQRVENLLSWDWHEKKHFENTSFGCPLCIKSFVRGGMLYVHILKHFENRELSVSCMNRGCKKQFYDILELCFHCFTEHVKNPKLIEDLKIEFVSFLQKLLKDKKVSDDKKDDKKDDNNSVRIFFENNDNILIKWVEIEIENEKKKKSLSLELGETKKKESPSLEFVEAIKSLLLEDLLTLLLEVRWSIREDIENQNRGLASNIPEKYYLLKNDLLFQGDLEKGNLTYQEFALFLKIFLDVFSEKTVPEEIMSILNKHVTDRSA